MSANVAAAADEPLPWNNRKPADRPTGPLAEIEKYRFTMDKKPTGYYTIGALAHILGREADTIRGWESFGWLPKPPSKYTGRDPKSAASRKNGQRRLYTKAQLRGIYQIAKEEGILEKHNVAIRHTNFPKRVKKLFEDLAAYDQHGGAQ